MVNVEIWVGVDDAESGGSTCFEFGSVLLESLADANRVSSFQLHRNSRFMATLDISLNKSLDTEWFFWWSDCRVSRLYSITLLWTLLS